MISRYFIYSVAIHAVTTTVTPTTLRTVSGWGFRFFGLHSQVLMRVARCSTQPRGVPQPPASGVRGKGWSGGADGEVSPSMMVARDMLRMMGQVLEEATLLGGGKVAAVTNEPALADVLAVRRIERGSGMPCFLCALLPGILCLPWLLFIDSSWRRGLEAS